MGFVAEEDRIAHLERLGIDEKLIKMSAGLVDHELFRHRCARHDLHSYRGGSAPAGDLVAPLWEFGDLVTGVRRSPRGLEFIEFSLEAPDDELTVLATTPQGLWAVVFVAIYEDNEELSVDDLREPGDLVGFRHVGYVIRRYDELVATGKMPHGDFLEMIVRECDGEAGARRDGG